MRVAIMMLNGGRGSGVIARQHAEELIRLGHDVVYLHPGMNGGVPNADNRDIELPSATTPVHEYLPGAGDLQQAVSSMTAEQADLYVASYEQALDAAMGDVDLVIGHHGNLSSVAVARVCRRHSVPYVLFLHGTGIEPRLLGGCDDRVWGQIAEAVRSAQGIIVTTEYVRERLVRPLVDVPDDRILVLPCGVRVDEFSETDACDIRRRYSLPERYVICPGAITALKGTPNVVAASIHYADLAPTIFIGDGDLRRELTAQLGDRGRFLGFVPDDDKAALIGAATILTAAPEKLEHFGIIYVEAMAASTVPVAYRGGGVDSIVTPATGVLTDRTPTALGSAIRSLLGDPDRALAMATAAHIRAERDYAASTLGEELAGWLTTVWEKGR